MPPGPSINATSTVAVIEAAARRGVTPAALLAPHGLALEPLRRPGCRLPAATVDAIWGEAISRTQVPTLPVWAALELPWGRYRVLDLLASSAATLGEGYRLLSAYFRIVNDSVSLPITAAQGGWEVRVQHRSGAPLPTPYVDYTVAACVHRFTLMGIQQRPAVELVRPAPADPAGHRRVLRGALRFSAAVDRLVFTQEQWDAPMPAADPILRSVLMEHADALLGRLSADAEAALLDIIECIWDTLPKGRAELEIAARRLGTSKRSLQRRLAEHGLTWRTLLAQVRFELARHLLRDQRLSTDDIAVLLGYAEASAFHRAFRQWSGHTPGAWRARQNAGAHEAPRREE